MSLKCSAGVLINEVMYNPAIDDNYYEWVEIYNPTNKSYNLSGWTISDNKATDELEGDFEQGNGTTIIPTYGFAIVTDHGTKIYENYSVNISNNTVFLHVDDKSICNGLGNSGDKLILKNKTDVVIDSVEWITNYSDIPGDPARKTDENFTIARISAIDNNNSSIDFYEGIPTLGYENIINERGKTKIYLSSKDYLIKRNEVEKIDLKIQNLGDFTDNITMKTTDITSRWNVGFNETHFSLKSNETKNITMKIEPCQLYGCNSGEITITAFSAKNINQSDSIELYFQILAPDLWIKTIKILDDKKDETTFCMQGEIVRIKAFLKNLGRQNATDINVNFYLDKIKDENIIETKYYPDIGRYQKYPSILFDTLKIDPGSHKIIVIVDFENKINELDEFNNRLSFDLEIKNSSSSKDHEKIKISEFYYDSYTKVENEYFKIFNPTNKNLDISGWFLSVNPYRIKKDQVKITFPENTIISANSSICITQNAYDYQWDTGKIADFEYNFDSNDNVSQMIVSKKVYFTDTGGIIALKDYYNHTADLIVYGNRTHEGEDWYNRSINSTVEGEILKRNILKDNQLVDTNTKDDWNSKRKLIIGQSSFEFSKINFTGEITCFISPDNSYNVIVNEIRSSKESIYLNLYEFTHPSLCNELIKALIRGVNVNIFMEGSPVGGIADHEKFLLQRINNYGGKIRFIVNKDEKKIHSRYDFNHAKYTVIDNSSVIVESCNWAETGIPFDQRFGNREWGVLIKNKTVAECFLDVFFEDYNPNRCDSFSFDDMKFSNNFEYYDSYFYEYDVFEPNFWNLTINGSFSCIPVFSPDNSYKAVYDLINNATESVYVEQLYIYKNWTDKKNPFLELLKEKSQQGLDVKVILNYNPFYDSTNFKSNQTKRYLEENGVDVKFFYTNWSYFTNIHNKGVIVDNRSVLISSINWNENSFLNNREAGIIIENETIAKYFADVFLYDWNLEKKEEIEFESTIIKESIFDYKNSFYITVIFTMTFAVIAQDWRKRKWR